MVLTSVNSIRQLAGVIDSSMNAAAPAAPAPKAQPAVVAPPAAPAAKAPAKPAGTAAAPRRRAEVAPPPRNDGAAGLRRMLAFVRDEYGLDLHGERFTSRQALIDGLTGGNTGLARGFGFPLIATAKDWSPARGRASRGICRAKRV